MTAFETCVKRGKPIMMEGALGERLKREYGLTFDEHVAMARLVQSEAGRAALAQLWGEYIAIAKRYGFPFLATTPTRRADRDRMDAASCDAALLEENAAFLKDIRQHSGMEMYAGGMLGCRGDAYTGEGALGQAEARRYHAWQAEAFARAGMDFLFAGLMPALSEAAGMAQAMSDTGLPYMISFTIQEDGRLIDGTTIADAIARIDDAVQRPPACYMTNCVHPSIVCRALEQPFNRCEQVKTRFLGVQANTSPLPYKALDGAADLHCAQPKALARSMMRLRRVMDLRIFGGCCGTDGRHMEEMARGMQTASACVLRRDMLS